MEKTELEDLQLFESSYVVAQSILTNVFYTLRKLLVCSIQRCTILYHNLLQLLNILIKL
jgi:hypothetical protein